MRLDLVGDVVVHLPISRSRGRSFRRCKRAAPPYSGTRTVVDDVLSPFLQGSRCIRSAWNPRSTTVWWWWWRNSCRASPSQCRGEVEERGGNQREGEMGSPLGAPPPLLL